MPPDDKRRGPGKGRPDITSTAPIVTDWSDIFADAERWVCWTARRRWPAFAVNDQIWACSVADWETSGRRAA